MNGMELQLRLQRPTFMLDVDLHLPGQGVSALFGPSGCGKTTLLRAVAGLERAHPGRVAVHGQVWQDDAQGVWRPTHERALGYVFQEASLFHHLSVRRNIEYGLNRTPAARRQIALEQAVDLLGIAPLLERATETLSGGERQRVAIARALATSPRVLLMDEPLAALDMARKAEVLPYLERLPRELDMPILYVSHATDEVARLASHLVLLRDGKVQAQGDPAELMGALDLPLAQGDAAATIVAGTVLAHDLEDHLTTIAFPGGQLQLVSTRQRPVGQAVRLRVQARDVSLTLSPQTGTSILNAVPAQVVALREDSPGQIMVGLEAGTTRLLARITQRSARTLCLTPGMHVVAQVKGIALLD